MARTLGGGLVQWGRAEAAIVGAELDRMGVLCDSVVCSRSKRSVEVRLGISLR